AKGRLIDIADRNGNKLLIAYDSANQISTVTDAVVTTRKLTFTYDNGHIKSIQDVAGRTWTYAYTTVSWTNADTQPRSHTGQFLVQASSPSTLAITSYSYTAPANALAGKPWVHPLLQLATEPDGSSHQFSYYPNGRVFEVTDADGNSERLWYNFFRKESVL